MYDYLSTMMPGFTCDMDVPESGGASYQSWFLNSGCCSSISPPDACDMDKLTSDAAGVPECADALASEFENEEESCACWDAMGEQYRTENFECLPEGNPITVMEMYNSQCVQTPDECADVDEVMNPMGAATGADCAAAWAGVRAQGGFDECPTFLAGQCPVTCGTCTPVEPEDECADVDEVKNPAGEPTGRDCATGWAGAQAAGLTECPAPLASQCPVTCGTCTPVEPEEDPCTLVKEHYEDVCQAFVPSTNQRAFEMCPDLFPENCDVVEGQCYEATLCPALIPASVQCDSVIPLADDMVANELCPCTCASEEDPCAEVSCTQAVCEDGSAAPISDGECCGNVDNCEEIVIPTDTEAPTKEVKVEMKLSMTDAEYENNKDKVKTSISKKFRVAENLITVTKVAARRSLRRMLSEVNLEVGIQTHDEDAVTSIIRAPTFATEMGNAISAETGIDVTVSDVGEPESQDVSSSDAATESGSDDDTNLTWLWVLIACVVVGALIGFVVWKFEVCGADKSGGETVPDGGAAEMTATSNDEGKRQPGTTSTSGEMA